MEKQETVDLLRQKLMAHSEPERQISAQRYFKETVNTYGVKTALVTAISKEFYKALPSHNRAEVFDLCEELLKSGILEESFIACNWSYNVRKQYTSEDFWTFQNWINRYVDNWATCDSFCNHTMGEFIVKYPQFIGDLREFTSSDNRWMRRAAAVSLIIPARRGKFLAEIFQIADLLISDKDDLVQKGYGWLLKVASQKHQDAVFEYVMQNKKVLPRTALRYAIEKMPENLKAEAMKR
jgi:Predicted DNA alkylation repair enzyme